jgi:hypothetical protein
MAFIQRNLPPPIKSQTFVFDNFTGGLNNSTSDSLLKDNECSDILNMTLNDEGTMEKRKGTKKYDNFNYGNPVTFMDKFRTREGTNKLIVSTASELFVDKVKLCDVSKSISGITYLNNYYFVDSALIRVYGKFPQVTEGVHIIVIGTPATDYKLMTIVSPPVYTPLVASYTIGVWKYDYTNSKIWYEPCQQELDDTYKGNNIIPTNPSMLCMHKDRLFMDGDLINPGNIFITDIQNAFYFPVGMPLQLPPNGQPIIGMKVFMDSVVIGRAEDLYVVYGNTNRTNLQDVFLMKRINTHTGFMNNNVIVEVHNYLMFLGSDGIVYRMHTTQTDVNVLATATLSLAINLFKYPIELDFVKMKTCFAIFDNDKFYLFHKDVTLVYSYKFMAWTLYKGVPTTCATRINNELVMGAYDSYMYISSNEYHDEYIPIVAYHSSKGYDFGLTSNYKQFKELYVIAHVYNDFMSTVNVMYEIDYVDIKQTSNIVNQVSRWGLAKWGDRFITRNISPSLPITIGRRGRKIRFTIMNGETIKQFVNTFTDLQEISIPVSMNLYKVIDTGKFYRYSLGNFTEVDTIELFQPLKVYEINGEFTVKGKR